MEGRHPRGSASINSPLQNEILDQNNSMRGPNTDFVPIFPPEIFEHIADYVFALTPPEKDYGGSIHSSKPTFAAVRGFMAASPALHGMGIIRWICVLTIRDPEDWVMALKWLSIIRELICLDSAFNSDNHAILRQFPYLHSVSIDAHNDAYKNAVGHFSYRDVFSSLPLSVLRLEVSCAHGPDLKIIETVRDCCPKIEVLRLGRCTMFNRAPACEFWAGFPFDHDAYIASSGTDDYAHSVAQEVASLTRLKHLRLGVYFAPSTTVLAHRAYHVRKEAAPVPINWQHALTDAAGHHNVDGPPDASQLIEFYHNAPVTETNFGPDSCSFCRGAFYDQSKNFESSASSVMKTIIPSLEKVEWMDWFTPSHLGVSRYDVGSSEGTTGS
ncbi:unnamed protein product [Rhizoctonia solani]|uniref:Uncharacterized protein n=1 Tax=Rhizoctonia solani TaxID=456999 RepID=A0A8H3D6V5_9AGAM|nr:unnamed protein product [Rhizoctonia solani]